MKVPLSLALGCVLLLGLHKPLSGDSLSKQPRLTTEGLPAADVRLIQTLNHSGIPVVAVGHCDPRIYASYEFRQNVVVVCTGNLDDDPSDTLRHESIHAVQDCKAGLMNERLALLRPSINPFITDQPLDRIGRSIVESYPDPAHHAIEWEAWTLAEALTSDQVSDLINEHCRS